MPSHLPECGQWVKTENQSLVLGTNEKKKKRNAQSLPLHGGEERTLCGGALQSHRASHITDVAVGAELTLAGGDPGSKLSYQVKQNARGED